MIGQLRTAVPVAGYGAYGLSADDLTALAQGAVDQARRGVPLASLRAELAPTQMLAPPTNAVGAYLRVAYWLAQAARPASSPGTPNGRLLSAAEAALRNAGAAGGFSLFATQTQAKQVKDVLGDGIRVAEEQGRTDAAAILFSLQQDAGDAPPPSWWQDPAGRLKGAGAVGAVAAVAAGGALLWLLKPYADIASVALSRRR